MVDYVKQNEANEAAEEDYNTSDPEQVNKARKKFARTRADRLEFVKAGMSVPEGRAWFYDLLRRCHVFSMNFNDDPYRTAFLCGETNIGNQILSDIQDSAPQDYMKMITENKTKNG